MLSSADDVESALAHAVREVQKAVAALPGAREPIILIDGRSGVGKSTVARRLREQWPGVVNVVGLDELYPGWDGLADGAEIARSRILEPIAAGRPATWRRWDWSRDAPGDETVTTAILPLIVEGAGILTPASALLAPVRLWLEGTDDTRRDRALGRDGDTYRPHWERWARQEEEHLRTNRPRELATIRVTIP